MKPRCRRRWVFLLGPCVILVVSHAGSSEPKSTQGEIAADTAGSASQSQVLVRALPSTDSAYVSLLKPPASRSLRSGYVCLDPGKTGEEHSTESYEEIILVLNGRGELHYAGTSSPVGVKQFAYVPPHTKHYLRNVGSESLRYIYIVANVEP